MLAHQLRFLKNGGMFFDPPKKKTSSFIEHALKQEDFYCFSDYLGKLFKKNCPFPIREVRELYFDNSKAKGVRKRTSWNGLWELVMLLNKKKKKNLSCLHVQMPNLYSGSLPISRDKLKDLQVLKEVLLTPSCTIFWPPASRRWAMNSFLCVFEFIEVQILLV